LSVLAIVGSLFTVCTFRSANQLADASAWSSFNVTATFFFFLPSAAHHK